MNAPSSNRGLSLYWPTWLAPAFVLAAVWLFAPPGTRRVLANSLWLALASCAIAVPVGVVLADLVVRYRLPLAGLTQAILVLLVFLPLYVQVSGWDAALGKLGWITLVTGSAGEPWLAGMRGAIFVHGIAGIPWVALIVGIGLAQVDRQQVEAALLEGGSLLAQWRVVLPAVAPLVLAAALWVAVLTATDMTVTNIYLVDPREMTFTEQFYMNYSTAADAQEAVLGVLPGLGGLVALILLALVILSEWARHTRRAAGGGTSVVLDVGKWRPVLLGILGLAILVLLGVPLLSLATKAGFVVELVEGERVRGWSFVKFLEVLAETPGKFGEEFMWTLEIGLAAATLATICGVLLAWPARRGGWSSAPAILVAALALAIPGPLVGVWLIDLLNQPNSPLCIYLYDRTILAPALAQSVRALPVAILIAWHAFANISDQQLAAAALDGAGSVGQFWLLGLGQRRGALAAAWLAALAVATGDLAWSLLVLPPGVDTIQRRVFGLVHFGVEEQVAGIALLVTPAYALLAAAIVWLLGGRKGWRSTAAN
jgi:iron(III) transport system permease protein